MNPWVMIAIGLAWAFSLAGVGFWQNDAGHTEERAAWVERENTELRTANSKITELNDKARAEEVAHANRMSGISTQYQKDLKNAQAQREKDIAAARLGSISLRFTPRSENPGRSPGGETSASASGCDGGATSELPREIVADLFALADDADQVAQQLNACQQIIKSDRNN